MGRLFLEFVDDEAAEGSYCCSSCSCDIAGGEGLIWQGMMGQCQPALLFRQAAAVNVELAGSPRQEVLSSGRYTLQDVRCRACRAALGWQYLEVHSGDHQYKRGTYLLSEDALAHRPSTCGAARQAASPRSDSSSGDELPGSSYRSSRPRSAGRAGPMPGLAAGYLRGLRGVQQRQAA